MILQTFFKRCFFVLFFVLFSVSGVYADVPQLLNYEGTLTDIDGNFVPDGDDYEIQFSIYPTLTEGDVLWTERWDGSTSPVVVKGGKFNVLLGSHNPFKTDFFDDLPVAYLGVKVGTDTEMLPRQRLASVAYAFTAGSGGIPKSGIIMWSGTEIPKGWALCDGQNGTPDLRDKFIVGAGNSYSTGFTGGTAANDLSHSHTVNDHAHHIDVKFYNCIGDCVDKRKDGDEKTGSESHGHHLVTDTWGSAPGTNSQLGTVENRPPYYALAFIMKL